MTPNKIPFRQGLSRHAWTVDQLRRPQPHAAQRIRAEVSLHRPRPFRGVLRGPASSLLPPFGPVLSHPLGYLSTLGASHELPASSAFHGRISKHQRIQSLQRFDEIRQFRPYHLEAGNKLV